VSYWSLLLVVVGPSSRTNVHKRDVSAKMYFKVTVQTAMRLCNLDKAAVADRLADAATARDDSSARKTNVRTRRVITCTQRPASTPVER